MPGLITAVFLALDLAAVLAALAWLSHRRVRQDPRDGRSRRGSGLGDGQR